MADSPNIELVRRAILAMNRADDDAFAATLDDGVEWDVGPNPFGFPEHIRGPADVVASARATRERAGGLTMTIHEVREHGDDVLVLGALSTGQGPVMPRAWIWTVRDGRTARIKAYSSAALALREWNRAEDSPAR